MSSQSDVLESVALGDLVESLVTEIARAQLAMDMTSLRVAEAMAQRNVAFDGEKVSVLELGLTPGFYQFVDTVIEVKISVTTTQETSSEKTTSESTSKTTESGGVSVSFFGIGGASTPKTTTTKTSTMDTRSASRFQQGMEASSSVKTRIVPVPPPGPLMDRLRIKDAG